MISSLTDGEVYTGRFDHRDDVDNDHREDRRHTELRPAEVERLGDAYIRSGTDGGEVHQTEEIPYCRSRNKPHQYRHGTQEACCQPVNNQDDEQCNQRQQEITGLSEIIAALPAGHIVHRYRNERQADDRNHRPGDNRREELQQLAVDRRGQHNEQAGNNDGAISGRQIGA
ncbi:hypothetical protein D3C73_1128300 [compost metagenome]